MGLLLTIMIKTVVITGGPGTGKTSVIKLIAKKYPIAPESARLILERNKIFRGKDAAQARGINFQEAIWDLELKHYKNALSLNHRKFAFFDRGYFDGFAYLHLSNIKEPIERVFQGNQIKYDYVFILDPLPEKFYENDGKRSESYMESLKIHKLIIKAYAKFGYKVIRVPFDSVENRAKFILRNIKVN